MSGSGNHGEPTLGGKNGQGAKNVSAHVQSVELLQHNFADAQSIPQPATPARQLVNHARQSALSASVLIDSQQADVPEHAGAKASAKSKTKASAKSKKNGKPAVAELNALAMLFNRGDLTESERLATAITQCYPRHGFGWKVLGAIHQQQGLVDEAFPALKNAAELLPDDSEAHYNLGNCFYDQNQLEEAVVCYQKAVRIDPGFAKAHFNLGSVLQKQGCLEQAEASYRKALRFDSSNAVIHFNLAQVLSEQGRYSEAVNCYRQGLTIQPNLAAAHVNLGAAFKAMGRMPEAEACCRKALNINPGHVEAYNNLSVLFLEQGRMAEAEVCCKKALEINPDYIDAYNNLGLILHGMGRFPEAEAAFERALEYDPGRVLVYSNFSVFLKAQGQITRAESYLRKAIEIDPGYINSYTNLITVLLDQGRVREAITVSLHALQIKPDCLKTRSNLLFSMNYSGNHSADECLEQARQYGRVAAEKAGGAFTSWLHDPQARRLRVGLVSGDLCQHAVAYFLENLVRHIDPSSIELIAYPTENREDAVTARLKPYFSAWRPLVGLNDQDAAQLIHSDGLHVLLDLSGHTARNRLPVLAWKPAPVQVSWLGYFATTGVETMDYFLADEVGVPAVSQAQFTEKIKYLPDTRLCFTAPDVAIDVSPLPALANGYITFGCFQNMAKVGDDVLDLWAGIMSALPNAKLRWQCQSFGDAVITERVVQRLTQRGFDLDRVTLTGSTSREDYLAAHAEIDVILDAFPFPGGTTTCEALWMGVPTLTLAGNTLIARQGASLLTAAGLGDWVADNRENYVSKVFLFTSDLGKLAKLRAGLREQVLTSPLFDAPRFAGNMEAALWEMWNDSRSRRQPVLTDTPDSGKNEQSLKLDVEIVSATRFSENDFWSKSALGLSLKRHLKQDARLSASIAFENSRGLSEVFNDCIDQAGEDAILVFIHDDVWIDEANFTDTVVAGLAHFDVIGVAGNRRRVPNQPAWAFIDNQFTWDDKSNLSGHIAHGNSAFGKGEAFGTVPAECELLDGVFLATRKSSLTRNNVRFDAQFDFHFYDMDFCRSARQAGLRLGTWLVKLTHQSAGAFGSQHWREKYRLYLNKWEETPDFESNDLQQAMNDVLQMALEHQNAGRIEQAEHLYQEILDIQPKHAEANHHLGVMEAHMKGATAALPRLELAVQENPQNEQFWVSYIDALMQSGATDSASDALELGQKYGLKSETAQILAAEFVKELESKVVPHQYFGDAPPFGIHIHQIYYSEQTRRGNDSGFIGLDNLANERPDWREYWPIRNYLLTNNLNEDDYYGFFSPKFKAKTNLDAFVVHDFIRAHAQEADVFLFSPFFDQGAFYLNMFEQGAIAHQGIKPAFQGCVAKIAPTVDIATLVMDSRNIVFCNYIVAKPIFWKAWLESCELIFAEAEDNKTMLAASLNAGVNHDGGMVPSKVFVVERIASLLLSTQKSWKVKAYNPMLLPYSNATIAKYPHELLQLDNLKITSDSQEYSQFLSMFLHIRRQIQLDINPEAKPALQQAMNDVLQMALEHQNAGRIEQAESLYLEILDIQPKHAEANHHLGVIEAHMKGALAALPRLELAVQENPQNEQFWVSYIDALMQAGATDTAVNVLELGQKYGLRSETAQMLAAEYVTALEARETDTITTLIPAYKHSYIAELLASLATQTYKKFRVIISDDSPNGEVTALINDPALRPLLKQINLQVIQGPRKGVMSNLVHLIDYWDGSTPLVHFLNDDDLIYPAFYQTHCLAHAKDNVGVSVSYRWYSNERGQPYATSVAPKFISESERSIDLINAQQLFSTTVPTCNNWLGEMSNAVLGADSVRKFRQSTMQGIPYFGLGDIGIFLQTSCVSNVAIIKNYLGVFRQNPQQNSVNFESRSMKCGFVAWIALALAGFKSGNINESQLQQSVDTMKPQMQQRYPNAQDMQGIVNLINKQPAHSAEFETEFLVLWNRLLAFDDWLFSQKQ